MKNIKKGSKISNFVNLYFIASVLIAALCFSSCASVQRVSADQQKDLSGRWSANDVREIAKTLIGDCLDSPAVSRLVREWKNNHGGQNPSCIVGDFRNSSSEHIDTGILSRALQTAIMNSGDLDFVADKTLRAGLREERQDQQTNASETTALALGKETAAAFMLSGEIKSMLDQAGNKAYRNYFVDAQLTNIETNRIVWQGQAEVTKEIVRAQSRL
ncbi:MAG: penicillin-binding protein activator LpoB [Spirochaetaceae bacterium]|jgi:uncharacterized protein (TIGR02722 family)|nr:penicillin-binding protein activator LpoB [Spirochaetaceae bacterium]